MDLLCALPFLTPDRYLRRLRLIPLLGTLEIGFELIGEKTLRQHAFRVQAIQERIGHRHLPDRIMKIARGYFEWGLYISMVQIESAGQLAGWLFNPVKTYRRNQQRAQAEIQCQADRESLRRRLIELDVGAVAGGLRSHVTDEMLYPRSTHLALGVVTIGGLWAWITAFPIQGNAGVVFTEVAQGIRAAARWFGPIFNDFLPVFKLFVLDGLFVVASAAPAFGPGWLPHVVLPAARLRFKPTMEHIAAAHS